MKYATTIRQTTFAACTLLILALSSCGEKANERSTVDKVEKDPHFELISAESSGIVFSNTIEESFQNNILINSYLYNGGGVAVANINGDDLPDLYFSATQDPNRLFINKGGLKFEDVTETAGVSATGGIKTGVVAVDINADGLDDLYVCKSGMQPDQSRANLLYVNNGDGTFSEKAAEYGLDDRSASNHANFFDYDLDGDLDVYILNHPVQFKDVNRIRLIQEDGRSVRDAAPTDEWESDKLFRNNGDGTFTNVSDEAGIRNRGWGLSITISDFNRDGYPDLFVGNDYIEPDYLYINQKDGTFRDEASEYFKHFSNHTMGVDIADFNNDGLVDVVALDMLAEDNRRQKELMTTMVLDRYTTLVKYEYGHQVMRNVLQVNTGREPGEGEVFADIGVMSGVANTDWSWSPLLVDLDNDGFKDLYITNGYRRDISNLDYLNYTVDSVMRVGGLTTEVFDSIEQYLDLIPSTPLTNYLYRNTDGLNFENVTAKWGVDQPSYSNGSAYSDLDLDGDMELIVNQIDYDVLLYKNLSVEQERGNWLQVKLRGVEGNTKALGSHIRVSLGDEDEQYQELQVVRGFMSSSEPILHFGLGQNDGTATVEVRWPDGRVSNREGVSLNQRIFFEQQNAEASQAKQENSAPTLLNGYNSSGLEFEHIENPFVDFNRERLIPQSYSNLGPALAISDVDGDGRDDVFVGGARSQPAALFTQSDNGRFERSSETVWSADQSFEDVDAEFFDADGDDDMDLFVSSGGSSLKEGSPFYQDRLYLNDGRGNFARADRGTLPEAFVSGSCVAVHDMDNDGDKDILVGGLVTPGRYPTPPKTCYLRNDGGRFSEVCSEMAPGLHELGHISDMEWADMDGDGNLELIVAGEWIPVSIFTNESGRLKNVTENFGMTGTNGWWNCVTAADLDGDGDTDLLAGNLGFNSRLKASADEPLMLYASDFDNNGSIDPIVTYYNGGKVYPLAQRNDIIKQLPSLKKKFVFHRNYGDATIEDIFSRSELANATRYEVFTFASSWFENIDGTLMQRELPIQAQLSPVNDCLVEDINRDGAPDIILVGNSSRADVETGRYDAGSGVILYGDGKGGFEFVPNTRTGFWATSEARSIGKVNLTDGSSLFVIANNNDALQVYRLQNDLQ